MPPSSRCAATWRAASAVARSTSSPATGRGPRPPRPSRASDRELHPLRQGQLAGVVDRVGRAAHVAAPRVGAGLPPAPGLLLPAEGPADLGAGGPDVEIGRAHV